MTSHVVLNDAALRALMRTEETRDTLQSIADQVADRARQAAPKRTGEGAASIAGEVVDGVYGYEARVSWDSDHFYLLFAEVGTSSLPARPFLRPALDGSYNP